MGGLDDRARQRIQKWLAGSGLIQRDLARKIGENESWLSRYLKGDWNANLDQLQRLAAAFDHSLFELLDQPTGNPEERELIERYRAVKAETRKSVLVVFRALTEPQRPRGRRRRPSDETPRE